MFDVILTIVCMGIIIYAIFIKKGNHKIARAGKWTYIVIFLVITYFIGLKIISKEWIPPQNAVKAQAEVLQLGDYVRRHRRSSIWGVKQTYYKKNIIYSYTVDGVEYIKSDSLESTNRDEVENFEGKIIQITYNAKKPDNVVIGNPDYTSDVLNGIVIIIFAVIAIVVEMGSTPLKESEINGQVKTKGKDTILKVIKIEFIDYEREKVLFESEEKNIYYYETDFGEEFQVDKKYQIKLNRHNQEKTKIEYEEDTIKAIKIVNTEKREFVNGDGSL